MPGFEFLFGLVILIADIYAIVQVLKSSASGGSKLLWTLVILVMPLLGLVIWMFAGPRAPKGGS